MKEKVAAWHQYHRGTDLTIASLQAEFMRRPGPDSPDAIFAEHTDLIVDEDDHQNTHPVTLSAESSYTIAELSRDEESSPDDGPRRARWCVAGW
jgi:hypothetical protein